MLWCPTMDLLAYVTSEVRASFCIRLFAPVDREWRTATDSDVPPQNHIALYRLSWVKLGTFSENTSRVTALAWSPDGRTLASGHEDGRIVLYDIELQETVASFGAHSARVTALTWAPWKGGAGVAAIAPSEDRASKFMPPVIPLLDNSSSSSSSRSNLRFADARKAQEMTVLLSGDANGVLSLRALGASCIGSVQICVPSEDSSKIYGVEITHISAAPDLSRLAVVVKSTAEDASDQGSSDASQVDATQVLTAPDAMAHKAGTQYVAIIDSFSVSCNAAQLLQISSQAWILESAIGSLHASLASMCKSWSDAWNHMSNNLKTFQQVETLPTVCVSVKVRVRAYVKCVCTVSAQRDVLTCLVFHLPLPPSIPHPIHTS